MSNMLLGVTVCNEVPVADRNRCAGTVFHVSILQGPIHDGLLRYVIIRSKTER